MDFNILESLLINELSDLKVNKYRDSKAGTIGMAASYVKSIQGCTVARISPNKIRLYYNKKPFGSIRGQRPSTTTGEGLKISNDKLEAEKYLKLKNINTTNSQSFQIEDYEIAKNYVDNQDGLLVIKPFNQSAGSGVSINVDKDNFDFAWSLAKKSYEGSNKTQKIIIQNMVPGIEARFLVIEGKFNSVILRVPTNIIGDGIHTVSELIERKNKMRISNPHLKRLPLKVNDTVKHNLEKENIRFNQVLDKNRVLFLHHSSNISLGGDSYEISHLVGDKLKQQAEEAIQAIPGVNTGGVDIMFTHFEDENSTVLEINPGANLRMHHYPWKGTPKRSIFDLVDDLLGDFSKKNL
ncbi:ATP-grasp domain-containing protein [Lacicoccus qingdaonensis]|uniref:Glutamate--cysteine ligase n=1 Tax=Lacicoccus qingdaonensis TaxID=576118 RepID=A0A1G9IJ06_9BACL|nr:ATP-grasp domain-containing protein [Salinicoccus qingdaonensis]SDL25177.1 glutamate--cysteine ligase [Salinicoccus qingdaonensis]